MSFAAITGGAEGRGNALRRLRLLLGVVLTVAWLVLAWAYVDNEIGWRNLFGLLPHELGAFLAGAFAPVVFIWLFLLYLNARAEISRAQRSLEARLNMMIWPTEEGEANITEALEALERHAYVLQEQADDIVASAESRIQAATEGFTQSFREIANDLAVVSESVGSQVDTAAASLAQSQEGLAQSASRAAATTSELSKTMDERQQALDKSVTALGGKTDALNRAAEARHRVIDATVHRVERAMSRLDETIANKSDEMNQRIDAAAGKWTGISDEAKKTAEDYAATADRILAAGRSVGAEGESLSGRADELVRRLAEATEALRGRSKEIAEDCDRADERIAATAERLADVAKSADDLMARSNQVANAAGAVLDSMQGAARSGTEVEEVRARLESETKGFTDAVSEASERVKRMVDSFALQTRDLLEATEYARTEADKVEENTVTAKRDEFLRASRLIMEDLSSIGADLNRVSEKRVPERLWRRYASGDRTLFVRALLDDRDARRLQDRIKIRYRDNEEFRKYADRYVRQFQTLLTQADRYDPEKILGSTFVTSDIGKLYVLLARASGQMD